MRPHHVATVLGLVLALGGACGRPDKVTERGPGAAGAGGGAAGTGPAGTAAAGTGGAAGTGSAAGMTVGPFSAWSPCGALRTDQDRLVYALSASRDGRRLAVLDTVIGIDHFGTDPNRVQQTVAIWDLENKTLLRRIHDIADGAWALDVDLSPDGTLVAITGDGSRLVSVADGQLVWDLPPSPEVGSLDSSVEHSFAFSPDGNLLAAGEPNAIEILAVSTGAPIRQLTATPPSPGLAFSPDGRLLASSGAGLWKTADWTGVRAGTPNSLDRFGQMIVFTDHWASFSPDAARFVVQFASSQSDLGDRHLIWTTYTQLLDAATGTIIKALPSELPRRPSFSPDGRWLLAGNRLLNLDTDETRTLPAAAEVSVFLPDGRIVAPLADHSLQLFCPAPAQTP